MGILWGFAKLTNVELKDEAFQMIELMEKSRRKPQRPC